MFTPVGGAIGGLLTDLEFLPGQAGESIVIGLRGGVHYLDARQTPLAQTVTLTVASSTEQGLLNVAADPDYASNRFVYIYYTVPNQTPPLNRVARYTVNADVTSGTFSLANCRPIIRFSKAQSANPGDNHNGGSLVFDASKNLLIGVGDGGGASSTDRIEAVAQNLGVRLGKIHRIIPDRNPAAGNCDDLTQENFSVPTGQTVSSTEPSLYAYGFRNPFTIVVDRKGRPYIGDVGAALYEEVDTLHGLGENHGWPLCEGPCNPPNLALVDPIHGYLHSDTTFADQDPLAVATVSTSIMVSALYLGSAYGGAFTDKLIYNEFYVGWVRVLSLDDTQHVVDDQPIGHQEALTGLHRNPANGFLYGVSLTGSDHVLRMDVAP